MNNKNIQQLKLNSKKKAIGSLILGVVSILTFFFPILPYLSGANPMAPTPPVLEIIFKASPIIAIAGLILGVWSLKSQERNLAIIGTILCLVVFCIFILKEKIIGYIFYKLWIP